MRVILETKYKQLSRTLHLTNKLWTNWQRKPKSTNGQKNKSRTLRYENGQMDKENKTRMLRYQKCFSRILKICLKTEN